MAAAPSPEGAFSRAQHDRRQKILEVALSLFSQRGYEGTSLRQIANCMGFSVAALYYHFRAKEELLALLARPYLDELEAIVTDAEAEAPFGARRGRTLLARYLELLIANRELTGFLERDLSVQAQAEGDHLKELTDRFRNVLAGLDPKATDLLRASAALGALRRPVFGLGELDLFAMRAQLVDQALKLLYPRARRRTPLTDSGEGREA